MGGGHPSQGQLLQRWRTANRRSQPAVAAVLGRTVAAVSRWESGENGITFEAIEQLDAYYGAGGALVDMAKAYGTPPGLLARVEWTRYPPPDAGPSWAWVRTAAGAGRLDARLEWGTVVYDLSRECGDEGVVLHLPAASPSAIMSVVLDQPGWVDYGRHRVPAEVGIPIVDLTAEPCLTRVASAGAPVASADRVIEVPPYSTDRIPAFDKVAYRQLRDGRCLYLRQAAARATALLPGTEVDEDMIRRIEQGVARPRCKHLRSRLDLVYTAGGYTCNDPVTTVDYRIPRRIDIPTYWIGPVWFNFASKREADAQVKIHYRGITRRLQVASGASVAWGHWVASPAVFVVDHPRSWELTFGMGARPGAPDLRTPWR